MKISEYKQLFLSEAQDILNSLNNVLVSFEKEPTKQALLHELFRLSHTLKSMAQSMGYKEISKLTHSMESALALLRSKKLKAEKETMDLLFKSLDALSDLVEEVKTGKAKKVNVAPLVARYNKITPDIPKGKRHPAEEKIPDSRPDDTDHSPSSLIETKTVRVALAQLDSLMDLTGELTINRIRLAQLAQNTENDALEEALAQMTKLTSQLQDQILLTRLVPLDNLFAPYPRMVRDMAVEQKKEVDFQIEGSHIGLDRSLQDEINEPLLHLLKNAVTHGIEEPAERVKMKKPRRGKIKLDARRERNFVVIELSDDGRGMDIEAIKKDALNKGILTQGELLALTPKEAAMLSTYSGYSRAKKITETAGRGVGLNASKVKVESLAGTLDIDTRLGEGTIFSIKLPLSLAIVQALLVGISDETYCIPLSYIAEAIKVTPREIKTMEHHEMISYRDSALPLIRLSERFDFPASRLQSPAADKLSPTPAMPVVVVEAGSRKAGVVVDRLLGQQEAVIKPLTGILKEIKGTSGATILGTGKVALIVDVPSLF
jgi:two-component system chemotaxis sensor kinase CheA